MNQSYTQANSFSKTQHGGTAAPAASIFDKYMRKIIYWGCGRGASVCKAYRSKGGWESWAQVELAIRFNALPRTPTTPNNIPDSYRDEPVNRDDPGQLMALREERVYQNEERNKADLLIWHPPLGSKADLSITHEPPVGFEVTLDIYSLVPLTHPVIVIELKCESWGQKGEFKRVVQKDLDKMNEAILKPEYRPCRMYCVALSVTKMGDRFMKELGMKLEPELEGLSYCPFHVFWKSKYIH